MIKHGIDLESDAIESFCQKWRIRRMEVFGSILRPEFGPESDVDFLVSFEDGVRWNLNQVLDMEDELSAIVDRKVDIVDRVQLDDPSANPYRKTRILSNRELVYAR